MTTVEDQLNERIKELTCLYEVTSIIVNCDYNEIVTCLKKEYVMLKKIDEPVWVPQGPYL